MGNKDFLGDMMSLGMQMAAGGAPTGAVEPKDFEHAGFKCAIRGGFAGCGYVGVPKGHPWEKCGSYWSEPLDSVDVHGGVTYAEWGDDGRLPSGLFWIGFDTAHADSGGVDIEAETRRLADQANEAVANSTSR